MNVLTTQQTHASVSRLTLSNCVTRQTTVSMGKTQDNIYIWVLIPSCKWFAYKSCLSWYTSTCSGTILFVHGFGASFDKTLRLCVGRYNHSFDTAALNNHFGRFKGFISWFGYNIIIYIAKLILSASRTTAWLLVGMNRHARILFAPNLSSAGDHHFRLVQGRSKRSGWPDQ